MITVTGSALSFGGQDRQVSFTFYENRTTNIFGNQFRTFGGYVVEG